MNHCPLCSGPVGILGTLGPLRHYLCRDCGAQFSRALRRHRRCRECGQRIELGKLERALDGALLCRACKRADVAHAAQDD